MISVKKFLEKNIEGTMIGSWKIVHNDTMKIADNGKPYGGLVRIVNDVDFETINITHNLDLKNPLYSLSYKGNKYVNKDPIEIIKGIQ